LVISSLRRDWYFPRFSAEGKSVKLPPEFFYTASTVKERRMSGQPFGDAKPTSFPATQVGAPSGDSPDLLSRANTAFNLAIGGIVVSICCCGIVGLVMGIMAMNNGSSVVSVASPGSEASSKANTAKILGIVAIVLGILQMISWGGVFTLRR
jgi:hypothetical protein